MTSVATSVIVVSRGRPDELRRCLLAIGQLDHARFETIVVACPAGAAAARQMGVDRVCDFDDANISVARNIGVIQASGDVLAFIDDDAVPEPTWLWHLSSVFEDPDVAQAGGVTLGRNGISVQHGAALVDLMGRSHRVTLPGPNPVKVAATGDRFPRLHGTNMAIRRSAFVAQGGFDPRFAFYLDETDLTLRIGRAGGQTVFVPLAIVHHASSPSAFRDRRRTPRSVAQIAASAGVFHRKHCPADLRETARAAFLQERRNWLLGYMQNGSLTPDTAHALIRDLEAGYREGLARDAVPGPAFPDPTSAIAQGVQGTRRDVYLVRSGRRDEATVEQARRLIARGDRVTVFDLLPGAWYHCVAFDKDGYWHHRGGICGREARTDPLFQRATYRQRIEKTLVRLTRIRSKNQLEREKET